MSTTILRATSLLDVIDRVVNEYIEGLTVAAFDKRQVELRVRAAPEFRRIHEVQMRYLPDIDIEELAINEMHRRVQQLLSRHTGKAGARDLIAVPSVGLGGKRWTWYKVENMDARILRVMVAELDATIRAFTAKRDALAKLLDIVQSKGEGATVGASYYDLSDEERAAIAGDNRIVESEEVSES